MHTQPCPPFVRTTICQSLPVLLVECTSPVVGQLAMWLVNFTILVIQAEFADICTEYNMESKLAEIEQLCAQAAAPQHEAGTG